jgi:cell wall-associated NlpC family hydrolase
MKLKKTTQNRINKHILSQYPNEACGLIVTGDYIPCANIHEEPNRAFRVDSEIVSKYVIAGTLEAVIHSHPIHLYGGNNKTDPRTPTHADQVAWQAGKWPWAIYATNGTEVSDPLWLDDTVIPPLIGREFIHGVYDCLSIIRDYYRSELNIQLPNHPRSWHWWDNGHNLYEDNFKAFGFYEIPASEARLHDVALFQVASPVINHGAVITGTNEITHHLMHRLSGRDSLARWSKQIVKYIRHKDVK